VKRLHLSRWFEYLFPAPFDFGLPELVPASEVEQIIARAKVRECRTDLPDLVTDDDLLAPGVRVRGAVRGPDRRARAERGRAGVGGVSSDNYMRVTADKSDPQGYYCDNDRGLLKVVPADAMVIEVQDFTDDQAQSIAAQTLGFVPRTPQEIARLHEQVIYIASALARIQAHPPIGEEQVSEIHHLLQAYISANVTRAGAEKILRDLRAQGWSKDGAR
jgi:hypothetical protein